MGDLLQSTCLLLSHLPLQVGLAQLGEEKKSAQERKELPQCKIAGEGAKHGEKTLLNQVGGWRSRTLASLQARRAL